MRFTYKHTVLALIVSTMLGCGGTPDLYDYGNQIFPTSSENVTEKAKNGDALAQVKVAIYHINNKNYTEAKKWLEKSAAQNNATAQFLLGRLYQSGSGVKQDYVKMRELWEKAAAQGNVDAQAYLGSMYFQGEGVQKDYTKAREYWEKAATQGDERSKKALKILNSGNY